MAKAKPAKSSSIPPKTFAAVIRARSKPVQALAKSLRQLVFEELTEAEESFYGGHQPMSQYRTTADVCWIQPLTTRCNVYFVRGSDLSDPGGMLEGKSERLRHVKVKSLDVIEQLPIRAWIQESVQLNDAVVEGGLTFDEVMERLRKVCLALPKSKETLTWGKPHFRVGEKIFCGCSEASGRPSLGLKMEAAESKLLMKAPGVTKAPYSRPDDGWVAIDPMEFDDWDEIERLIVGSFRLVATKRTLALLESKE